MIEETQNNQYQEETLNLEGFHGEELTVNLGELRQNPTNPEKELLQAPEDITFNYGRNLQLVDGFTPGALKNIITLTAKKLRVYGVSETKIWFISCSDIPKELQKGLAKINLNSYLNNILFHPLNCSIDVISKKGKSNYILKLNPEDGRLAQIRETAPFAYIEDSDHIIANPALPYPKNSRTRSFWQIIIDSRDAFRGGQIIKFGLKVKNQARAWLDLTDVFKKIQLKEKLRLDAEMEERLPPGIPSLVQFGSTYIIEFFRSKSSDGAIYVTLITPWSIVVHLVSLTRRKFLRTKAINLLDFLIIENLKQLLGVGANFNGAYPHQRATKQRIIPEKVVFDEKSDLLMFFIKFEEKEIFVKIGKIFSSNSSLTKNCVMKVFRCEHSQNSLISHFSDHEILRYYSGTSKLSYLRPLSLLNIEDLSETKIKGFEENKQFSEMSGITTDYSVIRQRIGQNKLLILTYLSAFIYDYERGEVVSHQRHTLLDTDKPSVASLGDIICLSSTRKFNFIRTAINASTGQREINSIRTIFVDDLMTGMGLLCNCPLSSLSRLENGNILLVTSILPEQAFRDGLHNPISDHLSLEINSDDFGIVKWTRRNGSDQNGPRLKVSPIHVVSGFLVLTAEPETQPEEPRQGIRFGFMNNPSSDHSILTLTNFDFEILDQCTQSQLRSRASQIGVVDSNRIISVGINDTIYLHEVEAESKKLVLLKTLSLDAGKLSRRPIRCLSPQSFCCYAEIIPKSDDDERVNQPIILNFDSNLNWRSFLLHNGIHALGSSFSVSETELVLFSSNHRIRNTLYSLNLQSHQITFVHETATDSGFRHRTPTFEIGSRGKICYVEILDEGILIVKLK